MNLRKLEMKDAPYMLEWMHDATVVANMQTNFTQKTINDCENFIRKSQCSLDNLHFAIVDEKDEYMGTVSLKHITDDEAEFAITLRKLAMGKGFSKYAMDEVIRIALYDLHLKRVYWCVSPKNERAIKFYDKNGYRRVTANSFFSLETYTLEQVRQFLWYVVEK